MDEKCPASQCPRTDKRDEIIAHLWKEKKTQSKAVLVPSLSLFLFRENFDYFASNNSLYALFWALQQSRTTPLPHFHHEKCL